MTLIGPKGKQIEDGTLEAFDLPFQVGAGVTLITGADGKFYARQLLLGDDGSFVVNEDGEIFYF